ncbi:cupin domain-containing protein [Nitrincola sp. MINF-07-Sa-05]|uniref:cupin domain-containing protein n=1 Tax=Nitrincola salilacus TaxID=3400273 RepID=UPI0039183BAC
MSHPQEQDAITLTSAAPLGQLARSRRKALGLTLQQVGERAHLSIGFISQMERNLVSPSLASLVNLAKALDVSVDYFVKMPEGVGHVSRKAERKSMQFSNNGLTYSLLSTEFNGQTMSAIEIDMDPGYLSELVSHEGEETMLVLEGELFLKLDGQDHVLQQGDSAHFQATMPHQWGNASQDKVTRVYWVGNLEVNFKPHQAE